MFDQAIFFRAFAGVGFLVDVTPAVGSPFKAQFTKPDESGQILDLSTSYRIEYQTADASLSDGDQLTIGADTFKVLGGARKLTDGYFSQASLMAI